MTAADTPEDEYALKTLGEQLEWYLCPENLATVRAGAGVSHGAEHSV